MDPLLFHIKEDVVLEVFAVIVLLSLIIERALSIVFEWRIVLDKIHNKGLKEPIAFLTSLVVVVNQKFDCLAILFSNEQNSTFGYLLTAGVIAGGSKGSIKLFRDWLGWKSKAQIEIDEQSKAN